MIRLLPILLLPLALAACGAPPAPDAPAPRPAPVPAEPTPDPDEPLGRPADPEELPPPEPEPLPEEPEDDFPADLEEEPESELPPEPIEPAGPAVAGADLPVLPGAVLPRQRIVAFYGNPASTRMGILGELPPDEMLARLDREAAAWRAADPSIPVKPALHLIAVMAAGDPGPDSLYRIRQPDRTIRRVMEWAERRDALVFLDIQPGLSSVQAELPRLREWLLHPHVHLALDPEWNMPEGSLPGTRIGTMSAAEVNYAIDYLAGLVSEHDLPPKVLVVHRFTSAMLRNAEDIRLDPRVQVVIHMDGWGHPAQKVQAYRQIVVPEAEQYTGFKLFFRNDLKDGSRLMGPEEILQLDPAPIYIQYQ